MSTGPPTIRPRNTVRRDHSISPSDTSNTRSDAVISDGIFVGAQSWMSWTFSPAEAWALATCLEFSIRRFDHFTRYWKTACRLSSGEVTSSTPPASPRRGQLRQPRIEHVRLLRLHDQRTRLELQAQHVVVGQEPPRERARVRRLDVDGVRMLVDQIADLMDVALRRESGRCESAGCSTSSPRSRAGCGSRRGCSCRRAPSP